MGMNIEGNGNIQIGELTINEMLNASQDKEYGDVDLSERSENELENAMKILSKERFGILCKGFTQYYMKKMYCGLAIFFTVLHAGGESLKGVITSQDNIFWWLLLFVGVLFLGFMGFISWAFNKMKRDNHSINELFKENWAKKSVVERELQHRKNLYWRKKCGIRENIFDYFEKE